RADHRAGRPDGCAAEPVPAADRAVGRAAREPVPSERTGTPPGRRPAIGHWPSAISHQPSAISHDASFNARAMMSSLNAIVPMACVTAAAIAAMVAEAFRDPGERMPIAGLGLVGLVGAAIATVLLWNHNTSSFGLVVADDFGLFVTGILIVVGLLSLAISGPTIDRERLPAGEYYALMLFATAGMMLMATASDLLV